MSSSTPLKGIELIDCAKANAKQGIVTTTRLCGYGDQTDAFAAELHQACQEIGVHVSDLSDLITEPAKTQQMNSGST